MNRRSLYIVLTFVAMQLSVFIGMPALYLIGTQAFDVPSAEMEVKATAYWLIFSFIAGLAIVLFFLRKKEKLTKIEKSEPLKPGISFLWAFFGIFLALAAQVVASMFEQSVLGVKPESQNTENILNLIEMFPFIMLISSIIGPILEEIVFRKVIFGALYNRFSFGISAVLSSVIFAAAHTDPTHLILYTAMGFVFAFLYVKTKRIMVPIFAHVMMNTFVVLNQQFNPLIKEQMENALQLILSMGGIGS